MSLVPADAIAVLSAKPAITDSSSASGVSLLTAVAEQAMTFGFLSKADPSLRAWLEVIVAWAEVARFPHTVVLMDISAAARFDGGHELSGLRAALAIDCGERHGELERRIRHLLRSYTNDRETTLTPRIDDSMELTTLHDRRLPAWATVSWGRMADHYVVAIGEGTVERMARALTDASNRLDNDAWFARAGQRLEADRASGMITVRFDKLLEGAERGLARKIVNVQKALRLDGVERGLWTVHHQERPVVIRGILKKDQEHESVVVADAAFRGRPAASLVPEQASSYAVIDCNLPSVAAGIADAYCAARSPEGCDDARQFWTWVERESGVAMEQDILGRMGSCLVIHNYPRHALALPFAWTFQVRIDSEADRVALQAALERLFGFTQRQYDEYSGIRIAREPDGLWYLDVGLAGPALMLTDSWLIISFSPEAVRRTLDALRLLGNGTPRH